MSGFDEHLKVVLDGYSNFLSSRELSDPQHHPGWDLEMGVVFNSCETGTICSSICNEKREKFLFILLATRKSRFQKNFTVTYSA